MLTIDDMLIFFLLLSQVCKYHREKSVPHRYNVLITWNLQFVWNSDDLFWPSNINKDSK
jgi:hypothetical protein